MEGKILIELLNKRWGISKLQSHQYFQTDENRFSGPNGFFYHVATTLQHINMNQSENE